MCVIMHKPSDKVIPESILYRAVNMFQDGWGMAVLDSSDPDGVRVFKDMHSIKKLLKSYRKNKDKELIIHCRTRTHGEKDIRNVHPFLVAPGIWLMHNGVQSVIPQELSEFSDTWHLARALRPLLEKHPEWLHDKDFLIDLGLKIGWSNRIALIDKTGIELVNKTGWTEKDGVTYSNSGVLPSEPRTVVPYYNGREPAYYHNTNLPPFAPAHVRHAHGYVLDQAWDYRDLKRDIPLIWEYFLEDADRAGNLEALVRRWPGAATKLLQYFLGFKFPATDDGIIPPKKVRLDEERTPGEDDDIGYIVP